ncbi:RsmD family RNA methyltransferase, partial [Candidatus Pelagibacter sp.]|nr:RsmD family RNA methyltransferase [Candidatus Pelagibacter sp.]
MRVIGGKLRGKFIHNPTDKTTRPLKDMVRESIFNILEHSKNEKIKFKDDIVLDLFSGSGSFGIECLSRGVKKVYFFETYKPSLKVLEKNINYLELNKNSIVRQIDAYEISRENIDNEKIDL